MPFRTLLVLILTLLTCTAADHGGPFILPPMPQTQPAATAPAVGLYVHSNDATVADRFPIVVELKNATATPLDVLSQIHTDFTAIKDQQALPQPPEGPSPSPTNGYICLVFHLTFPYPQPGGQFPTPVFGRKFSINPQIPPHPTVTLEKGKSLLSHIDLPPHFFLAGENTIEVTVVQYGKTLATSGPIQIHCAAATQPDNTPATPNNDPNK